MKIEVRADGLHISGYVNVTGKLSRPVVTPRGKVLETIEERAFDEAIRKSGDVTVQLDHDASHVYARTSDSSLTLREDAIGLHADKDMDIYYSNLEIVSKTYDVVAQKTTEIEIGNFKNAISRRSFMSETVSDGQSAEDKQNMAIQDEIKDNKLKMLNTWRGARAFTWREISKFTWGEVSGNGGENNES